MAISPSKRCQGAFLGHMCASNFDATIHLASSLSELLLQYKSLQPTHVFSRYMNICGTKNYPLGIVIDTDYKKWKTAQNNGFTCDEASIERLVLETHQQLNEFTAGCGPSHRSFPLALCPWISDETLFDLSKTEAALTHYSSTAGDVAGVINLICRGLIRGKSWHDAVGSALSTPRLHLDVQSVKMRYTRSSTLFEQSHPAYAPSALVAALYCVTQADSFDEAVKNIAKADKLYCAPIVGILAGVRWGITVDQCADLKSVSDIQTILQKANDLGNLWSSDTISIKA